jgi:hypothetical protein
VQPGIEVASLVRGARARRPAHWRKAYSAKWLNLPIYITVATLVIGAAFSDDMHYAD